jgi:hypothetical protein
VQQVGFQGLQFGLARQPAQQGTPQAQDGRGAAGRAVESAQQLLPRRLHRLSQRDQLGGARFASA